MAHVIDPTTAWIENRRSVPRLRASVVAWGALLTIAAVGLPLFVCRPLWLDATLYDLAARNVLRGGIHYRDIFDTNLPGMVWLHVAIRFAFGWSSEALRLVDFAIFAVIVWMLGGWSRRMGMSGVARLWLSTVLVIFYFWLQDSAHVQRDVWMLALALAALEVRWRQRTASIGSGSVARVFGRAFLEGVCWAAACWLKPFVLVPALASWLVAPIGQPKSRRLVTMDLAGLVVGGFVVMAAGVVWLVLSGAWPHFVDVLVSWDPEYGGRHAFHPHARRLVLLHAWGSAQPWNLVHMVALPLGLYSLWALFGHDDSDRSSRMVRAFIATFYLAWMFQFVVLHPIVHPHALVPATLIALTFVASVPVRAHISGMPAWLALIPLFLWAVDGHPLLESKVLAVWPRSLTEGSTPDVRDALERVPPGGRIVWKDLDRVAGYLRAQGVRDREVLCLNNTTHSLYLMLDLVPALPYIHVDQVMSTFPARRERLRRELAAAQPRFIVSDLYYLTGGDIHDPRPEAFIGGPLGSDLVDRFRTSVYPWHYPAVFRAGQFVVHRVTGPAGRIWPEDDIP